jgi:PAS domain S-box-containing protein
LKYKILIVEDESIEAMNFEQSLNSLGYDVVAIASTGKDALQKVAELKPDLILMDIILKGEMDGIEAATEIKKDFNVPVVYLTAHPEEDAVNRAKLTSPYGYLIKPVSKIDLKNIIELALYKHQMENELKAINDALMKRDEQFRHFIDGAPIAIAMFDSNMNYIAASLRWIEDYNLQGQELHGKSHYDVFPEIKDEWKKVHKRALAGSIERNEEDDFVRADGSVQYIRWEVHPWYSSSDDIGGIIIFSEDITERKKATELLRKERNKLQGMLDSMLDGVYIVNKDYEIEYVNPSIEKEFGLFKGQKCYEYINDRDDVCPWCKNDEVFSGKTVKWDWSVKKTGKTYELFDIPLKNPDGTISKLEIFHEITQRKKTEKALKESEKNYRNIFENAVEGIFQSTPEGYYRSVNPAFAKMAGFKSPEEMISQVNDIQNQLYANPEDRVKIKELLENYGSVKNFETEIIRKDGQKIWVSINASAVNDDKGNVHYEGTTQDITDHRKTEESLSKLSHLKEELLKRLSLDEKLELITTSVVDIFEADFARIWLIKKADLCEKGCIHANVKEGPHICKNRSSCLHLVSSTGRYNHIDGDHRRVPIGSYKIGRIASGKDLKFTTNDACNDPRVHDHEWAKDLGLVSFSGFKLTSEEGKPVGVLALFSKTPIDQDTEILLQDIANTTSQVILAGSTEEALKESEERYRTLFESYPNYTILVGPDGVLLDVNVAAEQITGKSREEMVGKHFLELGIFPKEDLDLVSEIFSQRLQTGKMDPHRVRIIDKNGNIRWGLNQITTIMKDDKLDYALVIGRDITEYKKAEDKLKENAKRFRAVAESAVDAIVTTDENGNIIFFNHSLIDIFGYRKEEMTGRPLTILMPERFKESYLNELQKFKESGEHRLIGRTASTTGLRKDGFEFPFEMSLASWKSSGKTFFTSIIRDVTKQKIAEEQIKDQLKKLTILNQVIDMANNATNIDDLLKDIVNSTMELLGFNSGGIYLLEENKRFVELIYYENFPSAIVENHSRAKVDEMPFSKLYGDKKPLYYNIESDPSIVRTGFKSVAIVPLYSTGKIIGSISIASSEKSSVSDLEIDILESIGLEAGTVIAKMYSEKATKDSLKEKEVLLKEIHHRVKNNLQIISSLLDLQEIYVKEDPTAVNVLEESKNRVISMAMIHEMLYQSKDLSHINFYDYINMMVSNLFDSYGANAIIPAINVEEIYLNIETAVPLGLIISELVSNSLKYAFPEKKGTITIKLQPINNEYKLTISDDGIGIPKNIEFDTESTLGLRLVNTLVNQLDGTIKLNRTNGTQYTITFKELTYNKRI